MNKFKILAIALIAFFSLIITNYSKVIIPTCVAQTTERRDYFRFENSKLKTPIKLNTSDEIHLGNLIDISRGGVAIMPRDTEIEVGTIIPIVIIYKSLAINSDIQVVFKNDKKIGAKFINTDKNTERQLLQLNVFLEGENETLLSYKF
jgi:hypothetical protein